MIREGFSLDITWLLQAWDERLLVQQRASENQIRAHNLAVRRKVPTQHHTVAPYRALTCSACTPAPSAGAPRAN